MSNDPITRLLAYYSPLIIDGALATQIEAKGYDISNPLWSASILRSAPHIIEAIHREYFLAGADIAITASYQASTHGLQDHLRCTEHEARELIKLTVRLADNARKDVLKEEEKSTRRGPQRRLLVAGSVGPYGAYLANGSEYTGAYRISSEEMKAFHRPRMQALLDAGVDVLACETMPSASEVRDLAALLADEFPSSSAWMSFTTRDPEHLSDGTPLPEVVEFLNGVPQIVAIGVNCVAEELVEETLRNLNRWTSSKPLLAYPNSGRSGMLRARSGMGSERKVRR